MANAVRGPDKIDREAIRFAKEIRRFAEGMQNWADNFRTIDNLGSKPLRELTRACHHLLAAGHSLLGETQYMVPVRSIQRTSEKGGGRVKRKELAHAKA